MAIYKNREVQVIGPSPMANTPTTIQVSFKDGTHENVKFGDVRFTASEKTQLQKSYPSRYENVPLVNEEDLKSVRLGVAPTYDEAAKDAARRDAQRKMADDLAHKRAEELRAQAEKDFVSQNTPKPAPAPEVPPAPVAPTTTQNTTPPVNPTPANTPNTPTASPPANKPVVM